MSATARIIVGSDAPGVTGQAIRVALEASPMLVVQNRAYRVLRRDLGTDRRALRFLQRVADDIGKPIGLNLETGEDQSKTFFLAPKGWTEERLVGWVGARRNELEQEYGPTSWADMGGQG